MKFKIIVNYKKIVHNIKYIPVNIRLFFKIIIFIVNKNIKIKSKYNFFAVIIKIFVLYAIVTII